jgi:hypothetical protein
MVGLLWWVFAVVWLAAIVCSPLISITAVYFIVSPFLDAAWQRVASAASIGLVLTPVALAWAYFLPVTFWMVLPFALICRFLRRRRDPPTYA